jgi:hypothetical protein
MRPVRTLTITELIKKLQRYKDKDMPVYFKEQANYHWIDVTEKEKLTPGKFNIVVLKTK